MKQISINDLNESNELDARAKAAVMGGHGIHVPYLHYHPGKVRVHWHRGPFGIRYPHLHFRRPRLHVHVKHIRFPWWR